MCPSGEDAMGEIPRVSRVEPPPQVAGQHLKVAQSSDRPGGHAPKQQDAPEDQVELHEGAQAEEKPSLKIVPPGPDPDQPRLDIAV